MESHAKVKSNVVDQLATVHSPNLKSEENLLLLSLKQRKIGTGALCSSFKQGLPEQAKLGQDKTG